MSHKGPLYQPGDKLLDVYVVERVLGKGAFNDVYLARHQLLPRRYAVKVLRSTIAETPSELERLRARVEREAIVLARFDHPNLPTLHDMRLEGGVPVLVIEYLDGLDLAAVLDKVGSLSVQDALYLGIEVAKPLAIAHQREIVHRDIKPENIFCMTEEPPEGKAVVRLLDFGASRLLGETKRLTREHAFIGTMYYVAPETLQSAGKPDHRVDIYSLGLVLWESLAGHHPFDPGGVGVPATRMGFQQISEVPAYIRDLRAEVPTRFADLIARMLAKNPAERPATLQIAYDEMWAVLSTMQHGAERAGEKLPTIFTRKGAALPEGKAYSTRRAPKATLMAVNDQLDTEDTPGTTPLLDGPHSNTAADGLLKPTQESSLGLPRGGSSARTQESQPVGPRAGAAHATLAAEGMSPRTPRGTELLSRGDRRGAVSDLAKRLLALGQPPASREARAELEAALAHEAADVRKAATQALSRVGDAGSRAALQRVIPRERDPQVRYVMELTIDLLTPKTDVPGLGGTTRLNDGFAPANPVAAGGSAPQGRSPASPPGGRPATPATQRDLPIVTTLVDERDDARTTFVARLATSALTAPRTEERARSLQALFETSPVHAARVQLAKRAIDALDVQLDDDARAKSLAELRAGGVDQLLIQTIMRGVARPVSERIQRECLRILGEEGDTRHALFLEQFKRDYVLAPPLLALVDQSIARVGGRVPIDLPSLLPLLTRAAADQPPGEQASPRKLGIRGQDILAVVSALAVVTIVVAVLFLTRVL